MDLNSASCFISYSEQQCCSILQPHITILRNTLLHVFKVNSVHRSGQESTESRIASSKLVFIFFNKAYLASNTCLDELYVAKSLRKPTFVYLFDDVNLQMLNKKLFKIIIESPYAVVPSKAVDEFFYSNDGHKIPFELLQPNKCVIASVSKFRLSTKQEPQKYGQISVCCKNTVFVCDRLNQSLITLDINGKRVDEIKPFLLSDPICVSIDAACRNVYIADAKKQCVYNFDENFLYRRKFNSFNDIRGFDLDTENELMFVAEYSKGVKVICLKSGECLLTLPICKPVQVKIHGPLIYIISDKPYNFISIIDKKSFDLTRVIRFDGCCNIRGLQVTQCGGYLITSAVDSVNNHAFLFIISAYGVFLDRIKLKVKSIVDLLVLPATRKRINRVIIINNDDKTQQQLIFDLIFGFAESKRMSTMFEDHEAIKCQRSKSFS